MSPLLYFIEIISHIPLVYKDKNVLFKKDFVLCENVLLSFSIDIIYENSEVNMEKIKIAIIGCGAIANSSHIPAYLDSGNAEIKYFCDIIPERADKAVEKYKCGTAIYDYHEILDDTELAAVSVCTPNNMHSIISIDFMRHGKDVLCEKPAARVLSEALEMQKVSKETGKILSIGVCNRYSNAVNHIKHLIESGALGEIHHVHASFRAHRSIPGIGGDFTKKSTAGGGALIDWGVHYLDLIIYCCNEPKPITASGKAFCKLGKNIKEYAYKRMWSENTADFDGVFDVDDSVTGIVRTEGPVISFIGAWAQNIGVDETYIDFMGDKGGIRLEYGESFKLYSFSDGMLLETSPDFKSNPMHKDEVIDFVNSVIKGERNRNDIDNAIITSKIMQAIYDSSDANKEVEID